MFRGVSLFMKAASVWFLVLAQLYRRNLHLTEERKEMPLVTSVLVLSLWTRRGRKKESFMEKKASEVLETGV